jgi:BspA type Leucine rich repeat region (6 copies)
MRNLILSALLLASAFQTALGEKDGDWLYSVSNNEATITGYTGAGGAVTIPSSVNGIPVVKVGDEGSNVFGIYNTSYYTSVTSVTIPNSVTSIGDYAFYMASLSSLSIGKGLASIGYFALYGCMSLSSITVDPSNTNYSSDVNGVLFDKNKTTLIQYPVGRTAYSYAIPESVTNIQRAAFHLCQNLVSITIPNSLTSIGDFAFGSCVNLVNISMPNGVATIGNYAFSSCFQLTSITIPPSVNWIGEYAFANCIRLNRAIFKGNAPFAPSSSFAGTNTNILYYPETSGWSSGLADRPTFKVWVGPPSVSLGMTYDGSEIMLVWRGTPDSVYAIQSTDRLSSPFITRSIITASGFSQIWDEPEPSSAVSRFYRIALVQP